MAEKAKKICRTITKKSSLMTRAPFNRRQHRFHRCATACLVILLAGVPALAALTHAYLPEAGLLSQQIASKAQQLASVTRQTAFNQLHAESILAELKNLITDYERTLVIAPTAYPGEFLLGTTGPGDGGWLETLCKTTYGRPLKEIRIRRIGSPAVYLRISDIEITYLLIRA